jgi:hypothetical protein
MRNRINFRVDAAFQKTYLDHLNALVEMSAQMVAHTNPNDLQTGQNMGTQLGVAFAKDGLAIAKENPKLLDDENIQLQDYEEGILRHDFLMQVQEKEAIMLRQTHQATILTGKDLMEKANWILNGLRIRKQMPKFTDLFERLYSVYKQRVERSGSTKKLKATFAKKETKL